MCLRSPQMMSQTASFLVVEQRADGWSDFSDVSRCVVCIARWRGWSWSEVEKECVW